MCVVQHTAQQYSIDDTHSVDRYVMVSLTSLWVRGQIRQELGQDGVPGLVRRGNGRDLVRHHRVKVFELESCREPRVAQE